MQNCSISQEDENEDISNLVTERTKVFDFVRG